MAARGRQLVRPLSTFVSKHTAIPKSDVEAYVRSRVVAKGGSTQCVQNAHQQTKS
jgi:hypothetical protein